MICTAGYDPSKIASPRINSKSYGQLNINQNKFKKGHIRIYGTDNEKFLLSEMERMETLLNEAQTSKHELILENFKLKKQLGESFNQDI